VTINFVDIANTVEVVQDGRIYIELINGPFLFREKGTPAEYKAGLDLAIERGWLDLHESGTFVRFAPAVPSYSPTAWVDISRHPICICESRPIESSRVGIGTLQLGSFE
jgi:hypothetical protein